MAIGTGGASGSGGVIGDLNMCFSFSMSVGSNGDEGGGGVNGVEGEMGGSVGVKCGVGALCVGQYCRQRLW